MRKTLVALGVVVVALAAAGSALACHGTTAATFHPVRECTYNAETNFLYCEALSDPYEMTYEWTMVESDPTCESGQRLIKVTEVRLEAGTFYAVYEGRAPVRGCVNGWEGIPVTVEVVSRTTEDLGCV